MVATEHMSPPTSRPLYTARKETHALESRPELSKRVGNKYLGSEDEHHGGGSAQLRAHKAEQIFDVGSGPGEDEQAEKRKSAVKEGGVGGAD